MVFTGEAGSVEAGGIGFVAGGLVIGREVVGASTADDVTEATGGFGAGARSRLKASHAAAMAIATTAASPT